MNPVTSVLGSISAVFPDQLAARPVGSCTVGLLQVPVSGTKGPFETNGAARPECIVAPWTRVSREDVIRQCPGWWGSWLRENMWRFSEPQGNDKTSDSDSFVIREVQGGPAIFSPYAYLLSKGDFAAVRGMVAGAIRGHGCSSIVFLHPFGRSIAGDDAPHALSLEDSARAAMEGVVASYPYSHAGMGIEILFCLDAKAFPVFRNRLMAMPLPEREAEVLKNQERTLNEWRPGTYEIEMARPLPFAGGPPGLFETEFSGAHADLPPLLHPRASQMIFVQSGLVLVRMHGQRFGLFPGDRITIPPGTIYHVSRDYERCGKESEKTPCRFLSTQSLRPGDPQNLQFPE